MTYTVNCSGPSTSFNMLASVIWGISVQIRDILEHTSNFAWILKSLDIFCDHKYEQAFCSLDMCSLIGRNTSIYQNAVLLRSCKGIVWGRVVFNSKCRMDPTRQLRGDYTEAFLGDFSDVCKIEWFWSKI